jgi:hypothetical protein
VTSNLARDQVAKHFNIGRSSVDRYVRLFRAQVAGVPRYASATDITAELERLSPATEVPGQKLDTLKVTAGTRVQVHLNTWLTWGCFFAIDPIWAFKLQGPRVP